MSGEFSITLSVPTATRQLCLSIWATLGMPAPSTPFALGQITTPVPLFATSDISFSVAVVICTTKSGSDVALSGLLRFCRCASWKSWLSLLTRRHVLLSIFFLQTACTVQEQHQCFHLRRLVQVHLHAQVPV